MTAGRFVAGELLYSADGDLVMVAGPSNASLVDLVEAGLGEHDPDVDIERVASDIPHTFEMWHEEHRPSTGTVLTPFGDGRAHQVVRIARNDLERFINNPTYHRGTNDDA